MRLKNAQNGLELSYTITTQKFLNVTLPFNHPLTTD